MYLTHIVMLYYDSCEIIHLRISSIVKYSVLSKDTLFFICTFATSIVETAA